MDFEGPGSVGQIAAASSTEASDTHAVPVQHAKPEARGSRPRAAVKEIPGHEITAIYESLLYCIFLPIHSDPPDNASPQILLEVVRAATGKLF